MDDNFEKHISDGNRVK